MRKVAMDSSTKIVVQAGLSNVIECSCDIDIILETRRRYFRNETGS
jgi:hypothetical protein